MEVNLARLAAEAEAAALKLRATGEEQWWPLLDGLAARLRAGDAAAAGELLEAIERPGGLAELAISPDNAPYVSDADAATVNRRIRRHINYLNLLAGLAVPGSRWHEQYAEGEQPDDLQDQPDGLRVVDNPYPARGPADSRTLEQRVGPLPRGPIDWLRVVFHGLCGAVTGAFFGLLAWPHWESPLDTGPRLYIIVGAVVGGLLGVVWGHGFWLWLLKLGQIRLWWWRWRR